MRALRVVAGIVIILWAPLAALPVLTMDAEPNGGLPPLWLAVLPWFLIQVTIGLQLCLPSRSEHVEPDGTRYAGFWRRLVSLAVDWTVCAGFYAATRHVATLGGLSVYAASTYACEVLIHGANILFLVRFGATPGKLLTGIRVVTTSFGEISYREAFLRSCVDILASVGYLVATAAVFEAFSYETCRTLGFWDRMVYQIRFFPTWYGYVGLLHGFWFWGEVVVLLTNRRRRALHDCLAGTVVIVNRRAQPKP